MAYNGTGCGQAIQGVWCPNHAAALHICCRCLGQHPVSECRETSITTPTFLTRQQNKGKGKGGQGDAAGADNNQGKGGKGAKGKGGKRYQPYGARRPGY